PESRRAGPGDRGGDAAGAGVRPGRGGRGNRWALASRPGLRAGELRGRRRCRSSGAGAGGVGARRSSWAGLLSFLRDDAAVVGELANQRIDLTEREWRRRTALDIAPHEAVVGDGDLQGGGPPRVADGGARAR